MSEPRRKRRRIDVSENDESTSHPLNSTIGNDYTKVEDNLREMEKQGAVLSKRGKKRKKRLEKIQMMKKTRAALGLEDTTTAPQTAEVKAAPKEAKPLLFQATSAAAEKEKPVLAPIMDFGMGSKKEDMSDADSDNEQDKKADFSLTEIQNQLNSELQTLVAKQSKQKNKRQKLAFKKQLAVDEVNHLKNVFAMEEFRANPFATIQQHLQNKITEETLNPTQASTHTGNVSSTGKKRVLKRSRHQRAKQAREFKRKELGLAPVEKVTGQKRKRED